MYSIEAILALENNLKEKPKEQKKVVTTETDISFQDLLDTEIAKLRAHE